MSDRIRFVFDERVVELSDVDPSMTVLQYLRTVARRTGTKEGCAEGDCGACTVVLGVLQDDAIHYLAVNACILFLPTLDGKQLITVEDLVRPDGELHPAQRAMVECHGSQCGFCTPGFVTSLFALYRTEARPTRQRVNDVLAGNLCRCTGYAPIVEAALRMYEDGRTDHIAEREPETIEQLRAIQREDALVLSYEDRLYFAPATLAECATLRHRYPDAHILSGGTDVGLWVTKEHRDLPTVIYIGDVPELRECHVSTSHIEIGAAVTYTDTMATIGRFYPDFAEVIRRLGSVQIRNAGTMVGNVATASPIGDTLPALIALGSSVVLRNGMETREVSLDEFFVAYRKTALLPGEFIERLRIPLHSPHTYFGTYKISKRFDQDIAAVCGAYNLQLDDGRVRDVTICYGGMAATPKRAVECERALRGAEWSRASVETAVQALDRDFTPISDMRASRDYRSLVAKNLLTKFYLETCGEQVDTRVLEYTVSADA